MFRTILAITLAVCAQLWAVAGHASTCDQAARMASAETGIPADLLRAITRVETGRRQDGATHPWPWTVNFAGEGHFFDDPQSAVDYVQDLIDQGETVIDVGCFQMNVKWHSRRFRSLEDMFDPASNARAAADFIGQLHAETGTWEDAVGTYHSRTPDRALAYAHKVATALAELGPEDMNPAGGNPARMGIVEMDAVEMDLVEMGQAGDFGGDISGDMGYPAPQPVSRRTMIISYPFLQGGQVASPGSLVPMDGNITPLIGG